MILLISFVAIAFAYYFMQKDRLKREERRERMREKRQELLERTIRSKMNKALDENDSTNGDQDEE